MRQIYVNNIPCFVSPEAYNKIENKEFVEFNVYHEDNKNVSWTRYYYSPFEEDNPNKISLTKEINMTDEKLDSSIELLASYDIHQLQKAINIKRKRVKEDCLNCKVGLYKVYWNSGGHSLAAIGQNRDGRRWISPINWVIGIALMEDHIDAIDRIESIEVKNDN